jgi:hypothetical protein
MLISDKIQINQEMVKSLFDYKDGQLFWKIKTCSKVTIGKEAGHLSYDKVKDDYRWTVRIYGKLCLSSRIIFLWHKGWLPKIVDHRDRNKQNNHIENLRAATDSQNCKNRKSLKNSTSKYLGVSLAKGKFWVAQIKINGKQTCLGRFPNQETAAIAYNKAAEIHHGEFANLNII